jgi:O-acetyl-ADP-ribose deacetylase
MNGRVPTGQTAYTGKGKLACNNYVIHTVGPIWRGGNENEDALLKDAV